MLEQNNLLDFDDLLIQTQLLCQNKPKQERCFDYLLVDEYQDINPLQYQLLQIWGKNSKGLFVIGDPDQSIYGFRGADAKCFEKLQQDYPALRQIRLVQNYRSTPQILDCALPMISKNSGEKRVLQPNRSDGAAVDLMTAQTPLSEGIFIAKEINRMVGGLDMLDSENHLLQIKETISCGFSDIAVLYRTHHQSKLLDTCLKKENIPYVVVGRDDFLTDPSVRGILSFFQTLLMPSDTIALSCCLKSLWNCPKDLIEGFSKAWRTVSEQGENILNGYRSIGYLQEFFRLAVKFRSKWQGKPVKVLENFLKEADLPETEATRKLLNTAAFYKTLPEMLACIAGGEENSIVRGNQKSYAAGAVTLMTLHAAKGLEYPVVFLAGVTQGNIPLESERHQADPEEERRLFYVGMTRAKDKLYLLSSEKAPSPFLSDIPNELLKGTPVIEKKTTSDGVQLSLF